MKHYEAGLDQYLVFIPAAARNRSFEMGAHAGKIQAERTPADAWSVTLKLSLSGRPHRFWKECEELFGIIITQVITGNFMFEKSNALIHVPSGNQTWQFMGSPFKLALMISRPSTRIASCVIPGIATSWLQGAPRVSKGPLQPTRDPGPAARGWVDSMVNMRLVSWAFFSAPLGECLQMGWGWGWNMLGDTWWYRDTKREGPLRSWKNTKDRKKKYFLKNSPSVEVPRVNLTLQPCLAGFENFTSRMKPCSSVARHHILHLYRCQMTSTGQSWVAGTAQLLSKMENSPVLSCAETRGGLLLGFLQAPNGTTRSGRQVCHRAAHDVSSTIHQAQRNWSRRIVHLEAANKSLSKEVPNGLGQFGKDP